MEMPDNIEPLSQDDDFRWSGLQTRIISAIVLGILLLGIVWLGGWAFHLLVLLAAMIMVKEWNELTSRDGPGWRLAGMFYAAIPCASLIWLRELTFENHPNGGAHVVLFIFFMVWATDIGAYFAGRQFGGPKLAPSISPNKTWAGLAGGMVGAALIGILYHTLTPFPTTLGMCVIIGPLIAIVAQTGDLFESWIKRRVGAKDSGTLIPGHGGLLDRIDGLTFAIPIFAWALALSGVAHAI